MRGIGRLWAPSDSACVSRDYEAISLAGVMHEGAGRGHVVRLTSVALRAEPRPSYSRDTHRPLGPRLRVGIRAYERRTGDHYPFAVTDTTPPRIEPPASVRAVME